jgi:signal transduction histidine kinase
MAVAEEKRKARAKRFVELFHNPLAARIILALAVGLTVSAWYVSRTAVKDAAEQRFEFRTEEIETAIKDRMVVYEQVLWGGVGYFNAADKVDRDGWNRYVDSIDINEHWPGIQGVGYAVPLEPDELDGHIAEVRAEGFPDYAVIPEGERDEYSAIVYLEPFDWRNERAFGFDMWSNDMRREAMTRARDTGLAATSGLITLVQETDEDVQRGFLSYVPVYNTTDELTTVAERRAAFIGWVYSPFRMGDLMVGILGSEIGDINYEIFDGAVTEEALLYDSNGTFSGTRPSSDSDFQRTRTIEIQGRSWTAVYESSPNFITRGESNQPLFIGIAGIVIDLLLFFVITQLGLLEKRATALAEDMTSELRAAKDEIEERSRVLEDQATRLERSNAELEQFAYIASHDLQEPLRNLGSYSTLLADRYGGELDEQGNRWLDYINSGSTRMSDLVRQLLSYSSISGNIEPFALVDLNTVVDRALNNLAEMIDEANVVVERETLPSVTGDSTQFERLYQNLLANAVKYRSDGMNPRVWIEAVQDGDHWRLSVRDNGIGVKAEYHDRIFEIFRRVGSRSEYDGNGIGLSVCQKIVKAHGGTIGVESSPGGGSTFWFTLPRDAPQAAIIDLTREDNVTRA